VLARGFDYWESGLDFLREQDVYRSFEKYQAELLAEFLRLAEDHDFEVVDARGSIAQVFEVLRAKVEDAVRGMERDRLRDARREEPMPESDILTTPAQADSAGS
jgi:hypothetical protein